MTIKLNIDGKEKEFETGKLKGTAYLKIVKAMKEIKKMKKFNEKEFLFLVDLIMYCFNKQFTKEQFMNAVNLEDIIPIYTELIEECKLQLVSKNHV